MNESKLFISFFRRNLLLFIIPLIICMLVGIVLYSLELPKTRITQTFNSEYNLENVESKFALTDQAVSQARQQNFEKEFPGTQAVIYKSAPLSITLEITSDDKNSSYSVLIKEIEYLKHNFSVSQLTQPEITIVEPSFFKYFIGGLLAGFLAGITLSLIREYLKNY